MVTLGKTSGSASGALLRPLPLSDSRLSSFIVAGLQETAVNPKVIVKSKKKRFTKYSLLNLTGFQNLSGFLNIQLMLLQDCNKMRYHMENDMVLDFVPAMIDEGD
jgi:hypothetical protein